MELLMAIATGFLYAGGLYMMMRRSIIKLIIGLALLSHGANLLIFLMGKLVRGRPAVIPEGMTNLVGLTADPVPQALILTAIVIGFAVQAFAVVLIRSVYQTTQTDDLDALQSTET
ncbi:MAG: Na+/H+ antiporter subunit C [Desulfobacteraceae bacterium]|nr:Na+/H+ antiporter subunit C [Desulfobacteraceae bacterium]